MGRHRKKRMALKIDIAEEIGTFTSLSGELFLVSLFVTSCWLCKGVSSLLQKRLQMERYTYDVRTSL